MFRQILIPTDFTKKNINPLEIATSLATKYKGVIHLLHVVEIIADTTFEEYENFYNKLEKRAQKQMNVLIASYQGKGIQITPHITYGNRVEEIIKFINENKIDLVIMNSHKVEIKNPAQSWGTISYRVALLSNRYIVNIVWHIFSSAYIPVAGNDKWLYLHGTTSNILIWLDIHLPHHYRSIR